MKLSPLYEDNESLHDQLFTKGKRFSKKIRDHSNDIDIVFCYYMADPQVKFKHKYKLKVELVKNNRDDLSTTLDDKEKPKFVVRIYSNNLKYLYGLQFKVFDRLEKHENIMDIGDIISLFDGIKKIFNGFSDEDHHW